MSIDTCLDDGESEIPDQLSLWDRQHAHRGSEGREGNDYIDRPSQSEIDFEAHLPEKSIIFEVGCANGRAARYWASKGHRVICTDFSPTAINQLQRRAEETGLLHQLKPMVLDVTRDEFPHMGDFELNGFFTKCAISVDDDGMMLLAKKMNAYLPPNCLIHIEGYSEEDQKIRRSKVVRPNLVNDGGHLRRVWTEEFMRQMCVLHDWRIIRIVPRSETYTDVDSTRHMLQLIAIKQ